MKPGRKPHPSGPWGGIVINARQDLLEQIRAEAKANNTTASAWLRWAVRMVLIRRWKPRNDGDLK